MLRCSSKKPVCQVIYSQTLLFMVEKLTYSSDSCLKCNAIISVGLRNRLYWWNIITNHASLVDVNVAVTHVNDQGDIHSFSCRTIETWKWLCLLSVKQWKTVVGIFYSHVIKHIWVRTHAFLIIRVFPIGWAKLHDTVEFTLISIMNHWSNPTRLSDVIKD